MSDLAAIEHESNDPAVAALTDLVTYLAGELVDDADRAIVSAERRGNHVAVRLELPEEHLGQAIGRGGRIARSLRTALMIAGSRHDVRVSLDIEGVNQATADA
jgi:predicted RNA-binding protein YlqC (UPF0109 family)